MQIVANADSSCMARNLSGVCVFVCLHNILKTDAARITILGIEIFHHDSWKPMYFVVKGQGHEARKTLLALVVALL